MGFNDKTDYEKEKERWGKYDAVQRKIQEQDRKKILNQSGNNNGNKGCMFMLMFLIVASTSCVVFL